MSPTDPGDDGGDDGDDGRARDAALAGEYVLRLLDAEAQAACRLREAREPEFAALVARWQADCASFDAEFAPVPPPRAVWGRIEARLWGTRGSRGGRMWRSAGLWRGLAATAALAAVWFAFLAPPPRVNVEPVAPQQARLISALASAESAVALTALLEPQAAVLSITRTAGEPAPGRTLELWLIEGDAAPVSLGVLPDAERARVPLSGAIADRIAAGAVLAISDEPEGGSTTGAPTGAVLATGALTEI